MNSNSEKIRSDKAKEIINRLSKVYPHPKTALHHTNALQLLIATILSAQANDKLVNQVTPELFKKYPSAQSIADTPYEEFDLTINRVNFHRNKAKAIQASCKLIHEKFNDQVPDTMEELLTLPGVARKTANVVLGNAYGKAVGIVVDTHVMRLSQRFGLTEQKDPVKIEQDLMKIVPQEKWIDFSHLLINFGREFCPARPHVCKDCPLGDLCLDRI